MADSMTDYSTQLPSDDFIRKAIAAADINALRIALYHQTRDPELAAMTVVGLPLRGGAFEARVVEREYHDAIRKKAFDFLKSRRERPRPSPDREESYELMRLFQGREIDPAELEFGYEDLGFKEHSRGVEWKVQPSAEALARHKVLIVGAGVSGLAAAIQLDRLGIDYEIVERRDGLGGTWHINDYPGARVDVSTFLYQYKFEKAYRWKSYYATQSELLDYLNFVADKYTLRCRIRLNTELEVAEWSEADHEWQVSIRNPDGGVTRESFSIVISAVGLFRTARMPDIEGIDTFQGKICHTTEWDHSYDLRNKKVGVIGTGSTGTQLVPAIVDDSAHVTVFQRTPSWITPIQAYQAHVPQPLNWLIDNMPDYSSWYTYSLFVADMWVQKFQNLDHDWIAQGGLINEQNDKLRAALTDYVKKKVGHRPDLYEKLVPDYAPTARRLVIDNGFYDALLRDDVDLETTSIKRVNARGIELADGRQCDLDMLVLAAGFQVSRFLWPVEYVGRNGATLDQLWSKDGPRAHLGMSLPDFPNFFVLYGPNAQARGGSFHSWIEILVRYVTRAIVRLVEQDASTICVRPEAFEAYNSQMNEAMKQTIWEVEGKGSYYVNAHGRSDVLMPWTVSEFYSRLRNDDYSDFELE